MASDGSTFTIKIEADTGTVAAPDTSDVNSPTAFASNKMIPQDGEDIKQSFSIDDGAEYLSIAEKYRDGTATEEETEQLRQMVDEAAKN